MKKITGITFKPAGKVYDFDSCAFVLKKGDEVIVETGKGIGLGKVAIEPRLYKKNPSGKPLKKVLRLADEKDLIQKNNNVEIEQKAHAFCLECIKKLDLKMNLFSVEAAFDASRLIFFFTSEGRVDFRKLVKMLIKELDARIEMRQVGVRNRAKMCGGLGRCGRIICCSAFMGKFEPVSIRMAKKQRLSLNPTKISGLCGRLMCCLAFENEIYSSLKDKFPKKGTVIKIPEGEGKVIRQNLMSGSVHVRMKDGRDFEAKLSSIIKK